MVQEAPVEAGVVAGLLPFCPSSRIAAGEARAAARARGQIIGATVPTTHAGDGSGENPSTMDGRRGALLPLATGFCLKAREIKRSCGVMLREDG